MFKSRLPAPISPCNDSPVDSARRTRYNSDSAAIPPAIMASAATFSARISRSNGSLSSFIRSMPNRLLTRNTYQFREIRAVAAEARLV